MYIIHTAEERKRVLVYSPPLHLVGCDLLDTHTRALTHNSKYDIHKPINSVSMPPPPPSTAGLQSLPRRVDTRLFTARKIR